jgi:hypothetical protein
MSWRLDIFLARKRRVSSAKICKRISLEMFFEGHKNLRTKDNGKLFCNFGHIFFIQKDLSFFITHFRRFEVPYIYTVVHYNEEFHLVLK